MNLTKNVIIKKHKSVTLILRHGKYGDGKE